jgi:hypothetical protein
MRERYGIVLLTLLIVLTTSVVSAQPPSDKSGMGLTVEGAKPGFIFSFNAGSSMVLEPSLFLGVASRDDNTQWHIVPGIGILNRFRQGEDLQPLVGVRFGADILTLNVTSLDYMYFPTVTRETYVDILFGPVFGARYFFSDNFAVSGEFQIAMVDTDSSRPAEADRFSDTFYITTTQLLAVYLYF